MPFQPTSTSVRRHGRRAATVAGGAAAVALMAFGAVNNRYATASTAPPPPPSAEFEARLSTELCPGLTGDPALTFALAAAAYGEDGEVSGSARLAQVFVVCEVRFEGDVDAEVGRPRTNVEAIIADPVNEITPNQAQSDLLNLELLNYWRVVEAWTG